MAVTEQNTRNVSIAAWGATVFPYNFRILDKRDLLVTVDGVVRTVDVHYTVSGVGQPGGGNITFLAPLAAGQVVMRKRNMALERLTDYQNLGDLRSPTLNNDQDAPIMMLQQLNEAIGRAISIREDFMGLIDLTMPDPEPSRLLGWNFAGTGLRNFDATGPGDMTLRSDLADSSGGTQLIAAPGGGTLAAMLNTMREFIVQSGRKFNIVAGVLRPSDVDGSWYIINDSGHAPIGVVSVAVVESKVVINFDKTFGKVTTFIAAPDEALSKMGFTCGASVEQSQARVELCAPLRFTIRFNGTATPVIEAAPFWGSRISATVSLTTGAVGVSHPVVLLNGMQPTVTMLEGSDFDSAALEVTGRGGFSAFAVGPISTRIRFDTTWVVEDAGGPPLSLFFNSSNGLAVQYGSDPSTDALWGAQVTAYGDTAYTPYIKQQVAANVGVKFKDSAGAIKTVADTNMDFQLFVPGKFRRKVPAGKMVVDRGYAAIHPADMDSAFLDQNQANVWFIALMETL